MGICALVCGECPLSVFYIIYYSRQGKIFSGLATDNTVFPGLLNLIMKNMEKYFFLPYWLKWIGFPVAVLLLSLIVYSEQSAVFIGGLEIPEELIYALLLLALLILFFSKEKSNNRFMSQLKAEALVVAVGINYLLLMMGWVFSYNSWKALDLLLCNICSLFLFWLLIFYLKKRTHKSRQDYCTN